MAKQTISTSAPATTLPAGGAIINDNFTELYNLLGSGGTLPTLTNGRIVVAAAAGVGDFANLTYSETSGPRLQVGSGGGTSAGWHAGYYGSSGYSALWNTGVTPGATNFTLASAVTATVLSSPNSGTVEIQKGGGTRVALFGGTSAGTAVAGCGLSIPAGTATTDVQALSATQTWNASGVTFTGWKFTITDTASASGSLAMQILGGASGTTNLFSVSKGGNIDTTGNVTAVNATFTYYNFTGNRGYMQAPSDGVWTFLSNAGTTFGRLQFGGITSSFPAIKRSSATLAVRLADDSADADLQLRATQHNGITFANVPGTPVAGMTVYITDSSTATWGATIAGGGANKVLAWYNGTNWTVAGA